MGSGDGLDSQHVGSRLCLSSIVYDPPEDGVWGALEASGNMSGLIGQAAYNEVDMVLSGVMTTRDR